MICDCWHAVPEQAPHDSTCPAGAYERGAADERARIVWWLRAGADGPASVSRPDEARFARDLADVIENHPSRFADAPPGRRR